MKKIFILTTIATFGLSSIYAQDVNTKLEKVEMTKEQRQIRKDKRAEMAKELDLTDEQKAEMKSLRQSIKSERKAIKESGVKPSKEQRQAKRAEVDAKLSKILSPEQKAKMDAKRAERKEKRKSEIKGKRKQMRKTKSEESE